MWFYCKTHGLEASFYLSDARPILLQHFSYKQINSYLDYLQKHGWLGRDAHGKIYLRGRKWLFAQCGAKSRLAAFRVEAIHTENAKAWLAMWSAVQLTGVVRSMKRNAPKVEKELSRPYISGPDSDTNETPVALKCITARLGVSIATASRIRTRAASTGLTTNRQIIEPLTLYGVDLKSRQDVMRFRGDLRENQLPYRRRRFLALLGNAYDPAAIKVCGLNPDAIIWKDNQAWYQRPNMVEVNVKLYQMSKGGKT